jgi:hypothetical protein
MWRRGRLRGVERCSMMVLNLLGVRRMNGKRRSVLRSLGDSPLRKSCIRVAALLLLFLVAGLATLAKNVQYLPKSNSAHYINWATKMKAAQAVPEGDRKALHPTARLVPERPIYLTPRQVGPETLPIQLNCLTVSPQQRSRPPSVS